MLLAGPHLQLGIQFASISPFVMMCVYARCPNH